MLTPTSSSAVKEACATKVELLLFDILKKVVVSPKSGEPLTVIIAVKKG
jgi:hypothetical protein